MPDPTHNPAPAHADPSQTPSRDAQRPVRQDMRGTPFRRQPDEVGDPPLPRDIRGDQTRTKDQSRHRRFQWFYEDLIS